MSFKEMLAAVQLLTQVLVTGWLIYDGVTGGFVGITVSQAAIKLLWVIGAVIAFSIVATIIATILVSMVRREEFKDEPADERDGLIEARSQRWSGYATSIIAALGLIPLALGADPVWAVYALFGAPMVGGTINAAAQLIYYRVS